MFCPGCGQSVPEGVEGGRCPSCGVTLTDPIGASAASTGSEGIPWEGRDQLGWLASCPETLRRSLFEPGRLFAGMLKRGSFGSATGPALFRWVPLCGGLLGFGLGILPPDVGLLQGHGVVGGGGAAAVLLPVFLCCACLGLAMAMFFGAIAAFATKGGGW